jgi:ABC-type sugar transport system permease subunit
MISEFESNEMTHPLSKKEHKKHRFIQSLKMALEGYMFLLPWIIGVLGFVVYPLTFSLYLSFHKINILADGSGLDYEFIGWENYLYAFFRDNVFPIELFLFLREALIIIPITVIFALLVSILLNQKLPGRMLYRTIFFLPVIFATGQVILELFREGQGEIPFMEQYDIITIVYQTFPKYLAEPILGILKKFVIILWYSGVQVIIFLAAYQTISPTTYEAAQIDGVTPWESFWKITFPAIVPFILLNLIYTVVELSMNPFNPILRHVRASINEVELGFGYASSLGWIYFVFVFFLIGLFVYLSKFLKGRRGGV